MRRNKKLYTIKEFYPHFFWQRCGLCHEEFKKEWAWKICFPTLSRIICSKCAPTFDRANELALSWGENGDNLKPSCIPVWKCPPSPPKRRSGLD